jgi:hypothetical protein
MGGLYRRLSHQSHPPYTSPSCSNVRPDDTLASRERLGMRPGISKHFATQLGSGNPVRLVTDVLYQTSGVPATKLVASSNGLLYYSDGGAMTVVGGGPPTLASNRMLTAADHLGLLYIAGSSSANTELCVYDPNANSLALVTDPSPGTVPVGCELVSMWRDRIVLAGDINNPHLWYMSKSGDPTNWDYSPGTTTSLDAVAATNSDAGEIGEPVRAIVPHSDECMLFGCSSSLWALRGDPQAGGRITRLSDEVGIIDRAAWCYDSEGYLYFLSQDGLYMMGPGCGEVPTSVSREKLPAELLRIDRSVFTVSLAYDFLFRGVHVFVSNSSVSATTHWWIDVKQSGAGDRASPSTASFWPVSLGTSLDAFSSFSRRDYTPASSSLSPTIMGCRDGYLRQYDSSEYDDDGTTITWHADIGPIPLAGTGHEGTLDELNVSVAAGSGNIQAAVRTGQSAESGFNASAFETFDLNSTGLNLTHRPRMRGESAFIRFSGNEAGTTAAIEDVLIKRTQAGIRRVI